MIGIYSSASFPLKITITNIENNLMAQATGQSAFPLDATSKTTFEFFAAGILLEFEPSKNEMTLKQGGGIYVLTKE